MNNKRSITLSDGKYEFYEHNHIVRCDRYGERWREFIGDKAIRALFDHATEQAEQIERLKKAIERFYGENALPDMERWIKNEQKGQDNEP